MITAFVPCKRTFGDLTSDGDFLAYSHCFLADQHREIYLGKAGRVCWVQIPEGKLVEDDLHLDSQPSDISAWIDNIVGAGVSRVDKKPSSVFPRNLKQRPPWAGCVSPNSHSGKTADNVRIRMRDDGCYAMTMSSFCNAIEYSRISRAELEQIIQCDIESELLISLGSAKDMALRGDVVLPSIMEYRIWDKSVIKQSFRLSPSMITNLDAYVSVEKTEPVAPTNVMEM